MPPKKKPAAKPPRRKSPRSALARDPFVKRVISILDDQKAEDIRLFPLDNHVAAAFVIATASGPRHLHSLTEHLLDKLREDGIRAHHVEGISPTASGRWVLVDLDDIVVHLFTPEGRAFYALDRTLEEMT